MTGALLGHHTDSLYGTDVLRLWALGLPVTVMPVYAAFAEPLNWMQQSILPDPLPSTRIVDCN